MFEVILASCIALWGLLSGMGPKAERGADPEIKQPSDVVTESSDSKQEVKGSVINEDIKIINSVNESSENSEESADSNDTEKSDITVPNLQDFIFPGSTVHEQSSDSLDLTSDKSTADVDSWYTTKLKSLNLGTNSFVRTKQNIDVHNELVVAGNGRQIRVTITGSDENVKIHAEFE